MKHKIVTNVRDGLTAYLGKDSQFRDHQVADIMSRVPSGTTTKSFIGLQLSEVDIDSREIGGMMAPTTKTYNLDILILLRGGDYDTVEESMDVVLGRLEKYLALDIGTLLGVEFSFDGDSEKVISYNFGQINTREGDLKKGGLGHLAVMGVTIKTHKTYST